MPARKDTAVMKANQVQIGIAVIQSILFFQPFHEVWPVMLLNTVISFAIAAITIRYIRSEERKAVEQIISQLQKPKGQWGGR